MLGKCSTTELYPELSYCGSSLSDVVGMGLKKRLEKYKGDTVLQTFKKDNIYCSEHFLKWPGHSSKANLTQRGSSCMLFSVYIPAIL
jgi:hypothetical protein